MRRFRAEPAAHHIDVAAFELADRRMRGAVQARQVLLRDAASACRDAGMSVEATATELGISSHEVCEGLAAAAQVLDDDARRALDAVWSTIYLPAAPRSSTRHGALTLCVDASPRNAAQRAEAPVDPLTV